MGQLESRKRASEREIGREKRESWRVGEREREKRGRERKRERARERERDERERERERARARERARCAGRQANGGKSGKYTPGAVERWREIRKKYADANGDVKLG